MAHLTDMAGEPPPDWSRSTVTVFVDTGLRTFSYSAHSLLPRSPKKKGLPQPLAQRRSKQKRRRKALRKGDRTPAGES